MGKARQKGKRNEAKARTALEGLGFLVEQARHNRFGPIDFFGLWDLIAVKRGKIRWVQVKSNRMPPPAYRQALQSFPAPGTKELWIYYDRVKKPRIILL